MLNGKRVSTVLLERCAGYISIYCCLIVVTLLVAVLFVYYNKRGIHRRIYMLRLWWYEHERRYFDFYQIHDDQ